ncbi:UbiA family prenyltransferase [Aeromicrobium sp.]|uniref:UbiA family prenyltransferase n=1 Tax=Aeromicrobium sp. TaxID=1871063 RepID=UPI003C50D272
MTGRRVTTAAALIRASHPEPGIAVSLLAMILAVTWEASGGTTALIGVAAMTGQLTVGWSNDLIDRDRDQRSNRRDKPLATGVLQPALVRGATALSLAATVGASLSLGVRPGLLHLTLVATGWAYNLGFKRTVLSWLPYAVCFGGLPVVVSLAAREVAGPEWTIIAGALLGTGAHLVNAVPDLEDDRRTGVVGLPHRLGARRSINLATALMLTGTVVTVVVPVSSVDLFAVVVLAVSGALLVVGQLASGRGPFRAVLGIALVNVVALLLRS